MKRMHQNIIEVKTFYLSIDHLIHDIRILEWQIEIYSQDNIKIKILIQNLLAII